jgi:hypothetical protein
MKLMPILFTSRPLAGGASLLAALALAACGPAPDTEPDAADAPAGNADSAATDLPLPEGDVVAAAFEGHLERIDNGSVAPFSLAGSKPEYYLLYYTASW